MKHTIYKGMMNGLIIDRSTRDREYNMINHWHPEYEIQYYLEGKRRFFIDGRSYNLEPGSLVIIDSERVHRSYSDPYIFHDRILLLLEQNQFQQYFLPYQIDLAVFLREHNGVVQIPASDQAYVNKLFETIAIEVLNKQSSYQKLVAIKLIELIVYLQRLKKFGSLSETTATTQIGTNELVNRVKCYIRDNYQEAGSLEQLSKMFYLDKFYFSRLFKHNSGYTVSEFINIQRIQQAQRLLEDTTNSITIVAQKVGYENVTYFNRVFKKYIETTPLQYRKKQIAYKESLREKNNF